MADPPIQIQPLNEQTIAFWRRQLAVLEAMIERGEPVFLHNDIRSGFRSGSGPTGIAGTHIYYDERDYQRAWQELKRSGEYLQG